MLHISHSLLKILPPPIPASMMAHMLQITWGCELIYGPNLSSYVIPWGVCSQPSLTPTQWEGGWVLVLHGANREENMTGRKQRKPILNFYHNSPTDTSILPLLNISRYTQHTDTNTHIYVHTYIHIHTHIFMCVHTYIHTYTHTYLCSYIYIHIHTYIHTYTHTHTMLYQGCRSSCNVEHWRETWEKLDPFLHIRTYAQ